MMGVDGPVLFCSGSSVVAEFEILRALNRETYTMVLDIIPTDKLTEAHLQQLVQDREQESRAIEFKLELPGNADQDRKEFLADFTSFANTVGGDLIYGLRERSGVAEEVVGLNGDLDAEINRLENIIRTGLQPRVTGYRIKPIALANQKKVLLFRIPKSWALPHRVTLQGHDKFYGRNSSGKYALDVPELRSLFLLSETTADRIRNFRAERISLILSGQTPIALAPGPTTVLHVVPFDAFSGGHTFDVSKIYDSDILPLRPITINQGFSNRHNFDGIVTYSYIDEKTSPPSYLQLFRSGIIESVDTRRIRVYEKEQLMIPGTGWEDEILSVMRQYFGIQANIGVTPPVIVMLSLLNVKGAKMYGGYSPFTEDAKVDRDHLLIPEVMAESFTADAAQLLKPIFDVLWNACGYVRSFGYGVDGQRQPSR